MTVQDTAFEAPLTATAPKGVIASVVPGLGLTALIATASIGLHRLPFFGGLSPLILSILIGMALHNIVGTPARAKAGVAFSLRRVLRAAIVLLGFQLTLSQIASVGVAGLAGTVATLAATFAFTHWAGHKLGIDRQLTTLIAAGSSICGASAVVASNAVVQGGDEDVAYAVATVTVFGSLSMVLFPLLNGVLHLSPQAYGFWTGATIHEVAQVVAAAFQDGEAAGHFGTIVKLTRVLMLAPVVLILAFVWARTKHNDEGRARGKITVPWFAFGFLGVVVLNSFLPPLAEFHVGAASLTTFLLAMALAAMGLETDIAKLRAKGLRPLVLGASSWIFVSCFGLAMAMLVM
ncbi:MAG: YeiH family protein [Parvibaculaceae bacterium]